MFSLLWTFIRDNVTRTNDMARITCMMLTVTMVQIKKSNNYVRQLRFDLMLAKVMCIIICNCSRLITYMLLSRVVE